MSEDLIKSAKNAAAVIQSIYQWLDKVEAAGGATSISGVAACNGFLTSLRKNAARTEELVMIPLRKAIAETEEPKNFIAKDEKDFVLECLANYSEILRCGLIDGAGHPYPNDIDDMISFLEGF